MSDRRNKQRRVVDTSTSSSSSSTASDSDSSSRRRERVKEQLRRSEGGSMQRREKDETRRNKRDKDGEKKKRTNTDLTQGFLHDGNKLKQTQYQYRLREMQTHVGETSRDRMKQQVGGTTKLNLWDSVVGDKTRGQVYGTRVLSSHPQRSATSLTQESQAPASSQLIAENERLRQELAATRELIAENESIRQEIAVAREAAARANEMVRSHLMAMATLGRQLGSAFKSESDSSATSSSSG